MMPFLPHTPQRMTERSMPAAGCWRSSLPNSSRQLSGMTRVIFQPVSRAGCGRRFPRLSAVAHEWLTTGVHGGEVGWLLAARQARASRSSGPLGPRCSSTRRSAGLHAMALSCCGSAQRRRSTLATCAASCSMKSPVSPGWMKSRAVDTGGDDGKPQAAASMVAG